MKSYTLLHQFEFNGKIHQVVRNDETGSVKMCIRPKNASEGGK